MTCDKCNSYFPGQIRIDGKLHRLNKRRFCFQCSPFGSKNNKDLTRFPISPNGQKHCRMCNLILPISDFYPNKTKGVSAYCKECSKLEAHNRLKNMKLKCIEYLGGRCSKCGYNRCRAAMEFHHLDKTTKQHEISIGRFSSWNKIKIELDKCILLCSNCHRETEYPD